MKQYDENKWMYVNDGKNSIRYILGLKGKKTLCCFGINPSTAEPEKLDNTVKSVERLALYNGYDSWIMFNVYPQRATDPNDMHPKIDPKIHKKNLENIEQILAAKHTDIYVAWGTNIEKRLYLLDCLFDIHTLFQKYKCTMFSIGAITQAGHPRHPLYTKSTTPIEKFDMDEYIKKLKALKK